MLTFLWGVLFAVVIIALQIYSVRKMINSDYGLDLYFYLALISPWAFHFYYVGEFWTDVLRSLSLMLSPLDDNKEVVVITAVILMVILQTICSYAPALFTVLIGHFYRRLTTGKNKKGSIIKVKHADNQ